MDGEEPGARSPDLGSYVGSLSNAVHKGIARAVAPYDLSPLDVQLMMVCRSMGECAATQLAQMLPIDASRISRLVTDLADKSLIRRRRLRSDRRVVMLRLTPEGQDLLAEASQELEGYYTRLTEGLTEREIRTFAAAAMRITANFEAMQAAGE